MTNELDCPPGCRKTLLHSKSLETTCGGTSPLISATTCAPTQLAGWVSHLLFGPVLFPARGGEGRGVVREVERRLEIEVRMFRGLSLTIVCPNNIYGIITTNWLLLERHVI